MRWELTAEQTDFRAALADWLGATCGVETLRGWLDAGDHTAFDERFFTDGWFGVGSAEDLGGEGGGLVELAIVAEELGRVAAPASAWLGSMLAVPALAASPEGAKALLADGVTTVLAVPAAAIPGGSMPGGAVPGGTASGGVVSGAAVPGGTVSGGVVSGGTVLGGAMPGGTVLGGAMPGGAVPGGAVAAGAVPNGGVGVVEHDGRLRGTVSTVLAAQRARRLVVPVATEGGWTLHLVGTDQAGVRVRARALTDRSRAVADVELDDVAGSVIIAEQVSSALEEAALRAAVLVAADALGTMEHLLDATVAYVQQRRQFGVPIGSFQAVKHAAAEILVKVEAARSIVYLAAASVGSGHQDAPLHAAAAKAQVCGAASAVADSALTLHGAIGYTWEHELQIFYKRAKLDAELFGSPGAWNDRLADRLELLPS